MGEASHPGPPIRKRTSEELALLHDQMADTQRESDGGGTPLGSHVGPAFEFVNDVLVPEVQESVPDVVIDSRPYSGTNGEHTMDFVRKFHAK